MGFWRAKQGLSKHGIKKTKIGLILGRRTKREGEGERREEEEEDGTRYGTLDFCMETTLGMDFVWITWNFKALYGEYLISKARVLIKLYPNLGFLKIGLIKPHMVQDNHRILSFWMDSWLIESL